MRGFTPPPRAARPGTQPLINLRQRHPQRAQYRFGFQQPHHRHGPPAASGFVPMQPQPGLVGVVTTMAEGGHRTDRLPNGAHCRARWAYHYRRGGFVAGPLYAGSRQYKVRPATDCGGGEFLPTRIDTKRQISEPPTGTLKSTSFKKRTLPSVTDLPSELRT